MDSDLPYEFRTTCAKPMVDERIVENIAGIIQGSSLYALQRFHDAELLHPEFFRDVDPSCGEDEMMRLKAAADPRVRKCIVR